MNASDLVTKSYYLSGIVSQGLESVSGSQLANGLDMLNEILDEKSADGHEIPFNESVNFSSVIGQEKYFIEGLIELTSLTFVSSGIRWPMTWLSNDDYHGSGRVDNGNSMPSVYTVNRELNGSEISVYRKPDKVYQFELWGKIGLENVSLSTDVYTVFPKFFVSYLKYAVAERICNFFNISFSQDNKAVLNKREESIFEPQPVDLSISLDVKTTQPNSGYFYDSDCDRYDTGGY